MPDLTRDFQSHRLDCSELLNFCQLLCIQAKIGGADDSTYLTRGPHSDDGASNDGIPERPSYGNFAGRATVPLSDGT